MIYLRYPVHRTPRSRVGACVHRADSWERVSKILAPFEDGLIMTVLRDTFDLAKNLKTDLECLEQAPPIVWSVTR